MHMADNSGMSLIEIMVVLAIVGILTSIAIPSYSDHVLKAKATEMLTSANMYKLEALEQEINNPNEVLNKTFNDTSPNIESIKLYTQGHNDQRRYIIEVLSKIATPRGNLELRLFGHAINGMLSWECVVPEAMVAYMPKNCKAT